jgi:hypothetical protein
MMEWIWCGFDRASSIICGNKMPTRCNRCIFIADLTACSTCFWHHYAHHQELESIIQVVSACRIWCLVFKLSVQCGAVGCVSGFHHMCPHMMEWIFNTNSINNSRINVTINLLTYLHLPSVRAPTSLRYVLMLSTTPLCRRQSGFTTKFPDFAYSFSPILAARPNTQFNDISIPTVLSVLSTSRIS